jgi:hypothetical protein
MTTKLIGYECGKDEHDIRREFMSKFNALSENDRKSIVIQENFQNEFKLALTQLEVDKTKRQKERFEHNLKAFLEDPKGVLNEFDELRRGALDLGELLISYGIAKTTIKRNKGKGVLVGKGTIGEHTRSNFKVTATIGKHTLEMEVAGSNDKRDKERSMIMVAAILAKKIANIT